MTSTAAIIRNWLSVILPSVGLALLGAPWGPWAVSAGVLFGWALGLVLVFVVWPRIWR
jgi:hypothetical protein